jgi:iron complex outermembrane recepter protein
VGLNLQTVTTDVQWHSNKTKPTGVTAGVQVFYQNNSNTGNFVLVPDAHVNTIGAFAVGHTDYKKFNFVYGIRIDAHQLQMFTTKAKLSNAGTVTPSFPAPKQDLKKNYTPYSFSAGFVFHPTKQWNLKLNAANGYAAPNYAQLTSYGKHEGTFRFELGNNNLKMEKNLEVDAGIEYTDASVSFSLGGYINSVNNYIYINPGSDSVGKLRVYRWTQHDAQINGIEASINVHPEQVKWFEAYLKAGFLNGKLKGGGDLPYIPAGKVITGFTWKKNNCKKWQQVYTTLQLNNYFKQSKVAQFEETTSGYFLADIFVGASPNLGKHHRWNLTAFCTNLFNKGYFDHLSLVKTIDVREPGRNIGLQVLYTF